LLDAKINAFKSEQAALSGCISDLRRKWCLRDMYWKVWSNLKSGHTRTLIGR